MDLSEPVMQAHGDLIGCVSVVLDPELYVGEHGRHFRRDKVWRNSDVELILPIGAAPFPDLAEHLLMQRLDVVVGQHVDRFGATAAPRPRRAFDDIFLFGLVEVAAGCDPGLQQSVALRGIKWRRVMGLLKDRS